MQEHKRQAAKLLLVSSFPKIHLDISVSDHKLEKITLAHAKAFEFQVYEDKKESSSSALEKLLFEWLTAYANKKPISIAALPLHFPSSFLGNAWKALSLIPFGHTKTYQEIAIELNNPKASRAVGTACCRNPYPLLIPCHRVLPKGIPGVGNFAFGSCMKQLLLSFEEVKTT